MTEDLKIPDAFDGLIYLADARTLPRLRPHRHVELEVNVVERGTITYVVSGRRYSFARRSMLWLFPDQEHHLVNRHGDARYYVAVFKPPMIAAAARGEDYRPLLSGMPPSPGVLHTQLPPDSFDLLSREMDAAMEGGPDNELLSREAGFGFASDFHYEHQDPDWLNAGLRHLLLLCWRLQRGRAGAARPIDLHPAVRKAMALMSDEPGIEGLAELARRCGVSESHLSRTFARQIGVPISRYHNDLRLRLFSDLTRGRRPRMTVTQAAYAAGFGSYAQFYRVFVRAHGRGPRGMLQGSRQATPPRQARPSCPRPGGAG